MTERVLTQRQKVEQRLAEITDHEFNTTTLSMPEREP